MAKLIKGYYINGVWHEYGGKLYDTIGYNTNGSMTQKAITENIGELVSLINGYRLAIRVIGDASVSNLDPFYFKSNGESFYIELTYNAGYALNVISIIMDGTDITQEAYQDGIISIDRVTGNVVITVETASVTDTNMFTKRTTANGLQVLNNKALLKRIKGNSMNFWQKLVNPDFSDGQTPWIGRTGYNWVITVEDGILSIKAPSNNQPYLVQETIFTEAHTYLCIARVRITDGVAGKDIKFRNANNTYQAAKLEALNTWYIVNRVITFATAPDSVGNRWFGIFYDSTGGTMEVDWAQCIDLTRLLGSQSANITYGVFHKLFPLNVYNQGSIIINNSMTNYINKKYDAVGANSLVNGTSNWWDIGGSKNVSPIDNVYRITVPSSGRTGIAKSITLSTGRVRYFRVYIKSSAGDGYFAAYGENNQYVTLSHDGTFERVAVLASHSVSRVDFGVRNATSGDTVEFKFPIAIDLTSIFGAGNEPTLSECNAIFDQWDTPTASDFNNWNILQNVNVNVPTMSGKLNGEGESVVIFPNGMRMSPCLYATELDSLRKGDSKASYFKIPYVPTGQDITIKARFSSVSYISTARSLTWFNAGTSSTNRYAIYRASTQDGVMRALCGNTTYTAIASVTLSGAHIIDMSFGLLNYGTRVIELDETIGAENTSMFTLLAGINAYLYYFQVYKGENLVVDCIPYRIGGTVGLLDRVNGSFITLTQASGEGVVSGVEKTYEELPEPVYDEIKQDNGIWKAYKRVDDSRTANNANTGRDEYTPLENEEVYVLDNQTIPTEITVTDQGVEEILPANEATPVTAPAIMEIQYGAIPSRGLLGGLLGGTKGGGSDEPDYSDGEGITDYEEEQEPNEDSDEPIVEEPLEEPKEDENEEEPKENIKESHVINEKQELKK